ncbi:MAG: GTP cyclohydrolase II [Rhodospirillaceae bacterium]
MSTHIKTETDTEILAVLETVDRAVAEIRRGSAVVISAQSGAILARPAETLGAGHLPFFSQPGVGPVQLAVTGRRAAILGLAEPNTPAIVLYKSAGFAAQDILSLIDPNADQGPVPPTGVISKLVDTESPENIAIRLTKIARLLPSVVTASIETDDPIGWAKANSRIVISGQAIRAYDRVQAYSLEPISEAKVPLAGSENTRIIAFRPRDGGVEHLAIIIGDPDTSAPVLTRLHSECFTGDLLGSLKCDCGDQLRGALEAIASVGAGVLLYLAQEGRGIGLVNKLRAYELQEKGFDTVDANEQLGFDDDERIYLPAVQMLNRLGIDKVRLLTNNPAKVGALARHGIAVEERVPHVFSSNQYNWSYLKTKSKRSGHLF